MNETIQKILSLLGKGAASPGVLANKLRISRQALHRNLKVLLKAGQIQKTGFGPHVIYALSDQQLKSKVEEGFDLFKTHLLPDYEKKFKKAIEKDFKKFIDPIKGKAPKNLELGFMLEAAAVYSSNIEGNSLNLDSFLNSRMSPAKHRPKEAQEIEDLVGAYEYARLHILNEKNMLKGHGLLSKDFVAKSRQGKYRQEPVGVFSRRGLEYLAVEPHLIQGEMKVFFRKIEHLLKAKLSVPEVIFWASWVHLIMALVHPFADGNGRIARLCEKWFLIKQLEEKMFFLPSEEFYFKNRPKYYLSLRLGVNYWKTDFKKSMPFLELLKKSLRFKAD